ncbi:beta strand repeat-containing protein [Bdellovibrio sp. HCB209]|uniref:beta strand repeat-containing protein n=1 Tax=Bdellovibrio sp. HCB209 TaxID=3394354 RepID=UPI0039B423B8
MMKKILLAITMMAVAACKPGSKIEDGFLAGVSVSVGESTISAASTAVTSGTGTTVTLTTRDSSGNVFHIPNINPVIAFSFSGGTSTATFSTVTNNNDGTYTATMTGVNAGTAGTLSATIDGVPVTKSTVQVTILPGNYSLANSYVSVSAATVTSGSAVTATFHTYDTSGNPLTSGGMTVAFSHTGGVSTGTFGTVTDHNDGTYSVSFTGVKSGTATSIRAAIAGQVVTSTLPTVTVNPGAATVIAISAGNNQSAVVGNGLSSAWTVLVTDAAANPINGKAVNWASSGNSSLNLASTNTNSSGLASVALTIGTVTGSYSGTATIDGTTTSVSFAATATPGAINNLLLSGVPASATAGTSFTTTVTARDSFNNVKTDYTGTIQFSSSDVNSPTLPANYTFVSGDAGTKQFSFTFKTAGSQTLTVAQSGGTPTVTSSSISVSAGAATQLLFITGPSDTLAGSTLTTLVVRALDANANTATSFTGNITVAFGNNPTTATLNGTKTVAATGGSASFPGLSVSKAGTGFTLVASATGLTSNTSSSFDIAPAIPGTFAISSLSVVEAGKLRVQFGASSDATSYTVKYGTSAGNYTTTASSSATSPYDITGLNGGTTYYVMVTATNVSGSTDATAAASAIPLDAFTVSSLTPSVGGTSVAYATSNGATSYDLLYDTVTHTASQTYASSILGVANPAPVTGLTAGTTYYFRVKASNSYGSIVSTNELSGAVYQNFTLNIPFTSGTAANYSFSNSTGTSLTNDFAVLNKSPQTDSVQADFPVANLTGVQWDSSRNALRLSSSTNTNSLDSSWTPQWSSLVAYYKFDGNLTDSIGSRTATATSGSASFVSGKIGQGVEITSTNYLTVSNIPYFNNSFSISMWIYMNDDGSGQYPIGYGNNVNNEGFWVGYPSQYSQFTFIGASALTSYIDYKPGDNGRWVHFMVTYDGVAKNRVMYRNGVHSNPAGTSSNITTVNGTLTIGRGVTASQTYRGYIDEVAIWNSALTETQVAAIFANQTAKSTGRFDSRVMDAQTYGSTNTSWTALLPKTTLPFGKEISGDSESNPNYSAVTTSLSNSLKAVWHFNETSYNGTANEIKDSSGNSNHASRSSSGVSVNTKRPKFNNTLYIGNGSGGTNADYARTSASNTFIASDNQSLTISGWVSPYQIYTSSPIISFHRGSPGETLVFGLGPNNKLSASSYNDGSTVTVSSTQDIRTHVWQHVAMTFNGTCIQLYIDGEPTGTCTNTKLNAAGSYQAYIGTINGSGAGGYRGFLDELAVWSRYLNPTEVRDLYRRSANRIRYQVRSCTNADCSDQNSASGLGWKGPDNTVDTYFSENYNRTDNSLTNAPTLGTSPAMNFSKFGSLSVTNNRFFQYRAFLDSDSTTTSCTYNSAAAECSPELQSVTAGPDRYDNTKPTVTATGATVTSAFQAFDSGNTFSATPSSGVGCTGDKYALSSDGTTYYYYNGTVWATSSGYGTASTATQISTGLPSFVATAGTGTLRVRSYLNSDGTTPCEIDSISVTGKKY